MKRKLDNHDAPSAAATIEVGKSDVVGTEEVSKATQASSFSALGLESRLLQAIGKENFSSPTQIQSKAIPIALEGKDMLARSKTGSGKTAAYILPILQSILHRKAGKKTVKATSVLILVPTRELAQQVHKAVSRFSEFCLKEVHVINLTQKIPEAVQRALLAELPDIVVTTPARAAQNLQTAALSLDNLAHLVIDEADLVLSYGYDENLQTIARAVPKGVQTCLMSATLTTEVNTLRDLFCRDPVLLDFQEKADDSGGVSQYVVKCAEEEKFLLAYVIFKLKLITGKCIVFVGDVDRCYRVKLFLEQFGIKSCVLNSELPVNSRIHVVEEFNKNVYDIIIAADEHEVLEVRRAGSSSTTRVQDGDVATINASNDAVDDAPDKEAPKVNGDTNTTAGNKPVKKQQQNRKKSKEYGVSRGIDFQNVSCVLNFDLSTTSKSYTHRIGRTARAGKTGIALSFVVPKELYHKHPPTSFSASQHDEDVLDKITRHQQKKGKLVKPYHFDMKQVDSFRYRMNDALRAVTRIAVREARTRELKQELLKSEKLKRHFEENPEDLQHLRHDGELRVARIQQHLRHVPEYLMPNNGKKGIVGDDIGFVGLRKSTDNRIRKARMQNRMKCKGRKPAVKRSDPLKTFSAKRRG